jgi:hypothetical protein
MNADLTIQLREQGVVLLRGVFAAESLAGLKTAAEGFFQAIKAEGSLPEHYRYNRFSNSVLLTALVDFGAESVEELLAPLSAPGLGELFSEAMGPAWTCNLEQSWVRKKFAPQLVPDSRYHLQGWHQDGALGVSFPVEPGPVVPMTELLTCWIPLNGCGVESPGLEFVRRRQAALLHFTELDDAVVRARFSPEEFWAPALELGDGLIFMKDILHRTYVRSEMHQNRLSLEYRMMLPPNRRSPSTSLRAGFRLRSPQRPSLRMTSLLVNESYILQPPNPPRLRLARLRRAIPILEV